jgi:hypothetical protein
MEYNAFVSFEDFFRHDERPVGEENIAWFKLPQMFQGQFILVSN